MFHSCIRLTQRLKEQIWFLVVLSLFGRVLERFVWTVLRKVNTPMQVIQEQDERDVGLCQPLTTM